MKISRRGAARNHGVESKSFQKAKAVWSAQNQELVLRSDERKSDFGSGPSTHYYRVALDCGDLSKIVSELSANAKSIDDDDKVTLRKIVPDLVNLINTLSAA